MQVFREQTVVSERKAVRGFDQGHGVTLLIDTCVSFRITRPASFALGQCAATAQAGSFLTSMMPKEKPFTRHMCMMNPILPVYLLSMMIKWLYSVKHTLRHGTPKGYDPECITVTLAHLGMYF